MKWWKSIAFSVITLIAVCAVSVFGLVKTNVIYLDAAASPVFASPVTSVNAFNDNSYIFAVSDLAKKGIVLSNQPTVTTGRFNYTVTATNDSDLLKGSQMLNEEFAKYSTETIKKAGLKKIYLVKDLSVNGQLRSGMPDPILEDALYFDISNRYISSEDGAYIRRTFHHEFKHLIDYNLHGSYTASDPAWESCNTSSFRYGSGGSSMYSDPEYAHKSHPETGFINGYATSGIDEDKAEVYANIMTNPEYLQNLANLDSALSCKVSATQQMQRQL